MSTSVPEANKKCGVKLYIVTVTVLWHQNRFDLPNEHEWLTTKPPQEVQSTRLAYLLILTRLLALSRFGRRLISNILNLTTT